MSDNRIISWQAARIASIYALFGGLWILFSDKAVSWLTQDPETITTISILKGWLFVAITALLLFALVHRQIRRQQAIHGREIEAFEQRQRSLNLLGAIAENSDDAIFAKDLEGRYLLFNTAAGRFVGKPPAEVLGRDDRDLFPPDQAEMLMAIGQRIVATGRTESNEEALDTPQGRRIFQATKGPLRDSDQHIFGSFGIARDITERKQGEAELSCRLEELERFNRASIGRELDMIRLKREVNTLAQQLGRTPPYPLGFADVHEPGAHVA